MLLRNILDKQATTIEYILHTHGLRASVDGGRVSPRLAHFHIVLPQGVRPTVMSPLVDELAEALGVVSCRLAPGDDIGVYLEVPRPDPIPVRLLPLVQRVADVVPPVTVTLGMDNEGTGTPLLLRLDAHDVDPVLICGNKGAGKSRLLRGMALSLALHNSPGNVRLLLLDAGGEGIAFRGMDDLPHLACPIANGPIDSLISLRWAVRTLARRSDTRGMMDDDDDSGELFFDEEPAPTKAASDELALVIMIDGVDALLAGVNRRASGSTEAASALNHLLAAGSRAGVHIVMSSERVEPGLDADWRARITGPVLNPEAGRIATGMKGSGAHNLLGKGDFLISLNAELIRFQAAHVSSTEVEKAVAMINKWANASQENEIESEAEDESTFAPAGFMPRPGEGRSAEPTPLRRAWMGD
jgi:DNA segregation ATPase FtsK/SpoIIIE-like protein